jgi:DNA-binding transcriptional ArsR family regulator
VSADLLALSPLDRRWLKALAHETRVAILRHMLTVETTTPTALANVLGMQVGTVSYHVRRLYEARQLTLVRRVQRRGALAHHYRLTNRQATADALDRMGLEVGTETSPRPEMPYGEPHIGSLLGEMEAACVFLERVSDRLRVHNVPGEEQIDAIPPSVLADVRRSCQSVARHSIQALSALSRRRAAAAAEAAAHARDTAVRTYEERLR